MSEEKRCVYCERRLDRPPSRHCDYPGDHRVRASPVDVAVDRIKAELSDRHLGWGHLDEELQDEIQEVLAEIIRPLVRGG